MDILLYLSYVGAIYGLLKVIYDMYKSKKWDEIRKSHEFVILIISVIVATCFFIPRSNFHFSYGNDIKKTALTLPVKKANSDSSKKTISASKINYTGFLNSHNNKLTSRHNVSPIIKPVVDTPKSKQQSSVDLSGAQINGGNNQFGNGNTQYITKPLPREVTSDILDEVERQVKDKNTFISIDKRNNDAESSEFAFKIRSALAEIGYKNVMVGGEVHDDQISDNPEDDAKQQQRIGYHWDGKSFEIVIPSNK
jgi:hypothetical protein